ncbi:MAG: hypothetical protein HOV81_44845 [Kofleriaceae bacterium]|nr:hypothetical protein [Kofleriaceae bacterium]
MHLVEAEAVGPIEGDDALVTPPRPPHRRVSVSLLFTLSVLIGTVVAIYLLLPARHDVMVTEAIAHHADAGPWDLENPTPAELRAWSIGVVGKGAPLPSDAVKVIGAKRLEILKRGVALMRLDIAGEHVTYLVAHARGIPSKHVTRRDGELRAEGWRRGVFTAVAVGSDATSQTWLGAFK